MLTVKKFTFNPIQENTYILHDETRQAIIIDAGCYSKQEQDTVRNYLEKNDLELVLALNTHCHIDHVVGNAWIKQTYGVPLLMHPAEADVLRAVPLYAHLYGFSQYQTSEPDKFIDETQQLHFGNSTLDILFVPGHSVGHLAFYSKEQNCCISGDVLFENSIGRTDLPGGDYDTLVNSIYKVMYKLPDNTLIYSGHGNETTIGREKKYNYFCKTND
jgi:glyoxylase-like metal-dependent hydrolase (beta-lactamase superfamily II)